ncbi:MAG: hypothetical protein LBF41_05010, partial [Deltaproteobacteria bacterium]|nr:hypothetical protein [Deltaproteobacteria bacterium]
MVQSRSSRAFFLKNSRPEPGAFSFLESSSKAVRGSPERTASRKASLDALRSFYPPAPEKARASAVTAPVR